MDTAGPSIDHVEMVRRSLCDHPCLGTRAALITHERERPEPAHVLLSGLLAHAKQFEQTNAQEAVWLAHGTAIESRTRPWSRPNHPCSINDSVEAGVFAE